MRAAILLLALLCASSAGAEEFLRADRPWYWEFPRDHGSHPEFQTEWWYFTGHLGEPGSTDPRFGFQFTFFRVGLVAGVLEMVP